MAIVGLSEFTFGYGFLFEQTQWNWGNLRIAPILPSLTAEAEEAWDARLPLVGTDFYYQFKLSDYLTRRNSMFHRSGTYTTPYFRIAYHRRDSNRQHHRLWQLAQNSPHTYYVAPEFATLDDFNAAFLSQTLGCYSRLIPLNLCDDCTDDKQHYLTYQSGDLGWNEHSDPKRRDKSYSGRDLEGLYRGSENRWQRIDSKFAESVYRNTTSAVKRSFDSQKIPKADVDRVLPLLDLDVSRDRPGQTLLRTARVLSSFTGATMVLVGSGP